MLLLMAETFAEVIFPLPFHGTYTYSVPEELVKEAIPGKRVLVSLGKIRNQWAMIVAVHTTRIDGIDIKSIGALPDPDPVVHPLNLEQWRWMARYYLCTVGEVMKAALPTGLKLDRFKPKTQPLVTIHPELPADQDTWNEILANLKRSPRQKALLTDFALKVSLFTSDPKNGILKPELLGKGQFSEAALNGLISKKILAVSHVRVSRIPGIQGDENLISTLNDAQQKALNSIHGQLSVRQVILLHGITASGKTEIYIHLIRETLQQGRQVLYLVPEIALTPQIEERLARVFGSRVCTYHSRMSDPERVEVWNRVLTASNNKNQACQLILGTRSSVFLPFQELGLIIVDEEHDSSFKQSESSPRYHARDMATVLGSLHKCPVILGSATPSFETYFNAHSGKYGLVTLAERFGQAPLPDVVIADVRKSRKRREMQSVFTPELISGMKKALGDGEQIILFQNRRGYSSFLECGDCGHIPVCPNCDVSLTCHLNLHQLICHYCGFRLTIPETCPSCGSGEIKNRGFGTEMVESAITGLFPSARITRMDMDTTRSRNAFHRIIKALEERKTDILIGTQMVTKGLDIGNIMLAGVLNADILLNHPDFRSTERAFQLMYQVSGRPGRSSGQGKVVIQTSHPDHPVFQFIREQDFHGFFKEMVAERKTFSYPPWVRLIKIILKHKDPVHLHMIARLTADRLRNLNLFGVLGPESPVVGKVQNRYLREIWLKIPKEQKTSEIQEALFKISSDIRQMHGNLRLMFQIDVDPV
jgi:primosomal protein N' (replication factor Y) (superfamily II helicase)